MRDEIVEYVERLTWLPTLRDVHEMLAIRHCGMFRVSHLNKLARELHDAAAIELMPNRLAPNTRVLPKALSQKLHA